mmetsp:Transcript_21272/g.29802  ORF Transcript_21272/g.29802 Transcript_21272/m.29802 type:complete len:98 (-) Transcript_21272:2956-3249(-)
MKPVSYIKIGSVVTVRKGKYNGLLGVVIGIKNENKTLIKTVNSENIVVNKAFLLVTKYIIIGPYEFFIKNSSSTPRNKILKKIALSLNKASKILASH